ncbi:NUDIX hydrolase [Candidatus Desantisbacteria bacterium]|nr:NUDIX hydrolase [Candidatus Desantisbacteria bacterium]
MKKYIYCPHCKTRIEKYVNPLPTADVIIECVTPSKETGIILIERKNRPKGYWAIPGGFVEYGESLEDCAVRESKEETGLKVKLIAQFHTYSSPRRDPYHHTITTVFIAKAYGYPKAGDDAKDAKIFTAKNLPEKIAFDHRKILKQYFKCKK